MIGDAMIAIKKIVFATDFSDCAGAAQEYAVALASQFHAELHILYVMQDIALVMPDAGTVLSMPQNYLADQKNEAQRSLDRLLPDAAKEGLSIVRSLRMGNPFVEIVKYAEEVDGDLIVVGTHGRGALMHLLLGSVAEKVVRKAKCPVLSVRPLE
jgi:nucleotide-binding universal stress UspA family protein